MTQSGSAATKNLTTDLKLTRYPRSLAATLAAFPSVSLFPQLGSLITRIWIGQNASMAFRTACPPVCGKCFGSARRLRIAFRPRGLLPKRRREDAHALKKSRHCGTKHNGQNLRKLRRFSSIVVRMTRMLGMTRLRPAVAGLRRGRRNPNDE